MSEATELRLEVVNDNGRPMLVVVRVTEVVRVPIDGSTIPHVAASMERAMRAPPREGG